MKKQTMNESFFSRIKKTETCWIWTGSKNVRGYGKFSFNGKIVSAYRWSYEFHNEKKIDEDKEIDHLCFNKACVNPEHLEEVTHQENIRRYAATKTHCKWGHEFTKENTLSAYNGKDHRRCLMCHRKTKRRIYLSKTPHVVKRRFSPMREIDKEYQ